MPSLPRINGRTALKAFANDGWTLARQKGSHMILVKDGSWATLSVPDHRELAPGTLRGLIRAAGLTVDEFMALLGK
jgi:predicted RNA binding protein YcfA (HicA-like mRNA interferase family)